MNIPEAQKRIEEINEETGMTDPFPKFDQPDPPPPVEAPEEAPAEASQAEAPEEEAEATTAASPEAPAPDDDIAWVKANKGFDVTDPVVAKTLRNQEEMIRRQGTEVGEARKAIERERLEREAFQAQMEQRFEQDFEPDENWEDWVDESLQTVMASPDPDFSPLNVIIEAGNAGGPAAARFALHRWHMIDPAGATAFQVEAAQQQGQQQTVQVDDSPDAVWARVQARRPDLRDYEEAMNALLVEDKEIREQMDELVSKDKDAALERLYLEVRIRQTDKQRSDALAKANAARTAAADASARDATVASATASAGHGEGRPLTEAEQVRANIRAELGLVIPD